MPPKVPKSPITQPLKSSTNTDTDDSYASPRCVSLSIEFIGEAPGPGDWLLLALFDGAVILDGKWHHGNMIKAETLPLNLKDSIIHAKIADKPLIFLLRCVGGKGGKDPDPLLNTDNRAGATLDMLPLVMGEQEIFTRVNLVSITTGNSIGCRLQVHMISFGNSDNYKVPLLLTMISAHCMPPTKEGTVYISAIGLNEVINPIAVNFGMSLSNAAAEKLMWATAVNAGPVANTEYNVPNDDNYVTQDLILRNTEDCRNVYWNSVKRVLVEPDELKQRLSTYFIMEVAGVPRVGKADIRGRYIGFVDAGVLLEPGQYGVTMCVKLQMFKETAFVDHGPLLDIPPTSAKVSARQVEIPDGVLDEYQHFAYAVIRLDLQEPLTPKAKMATLYETIGFPPPEGPSAPVNFLDIESPRDDTGLDVNRIRNEGGALSVHKELSGFACKGAVAMNQGIKRTAANRLLMRVRSLLKHFPPGDCSYIEWQDTVTAQHNASRRAVTASFAPQPPVMHLGERLVASRARMGGNERIAEIYDELNLKRFDKHPRILLSKVLRCLEEQNESNAKIYLLQGLSAHTRNRYLLLILGGMDFDKQGESLDIASAAFRIAVKGDISDGTTNAIGWAAIHAFHHHNGNSYAAFIASKKMRKSYKLKQQWKKFVHRWIDASGEDEIYWIPNDIATENPLMIAAAFFLCLRCFNFCERLLQCIEEGCATRGSFQLKCKDTADVHYIRAASLLIRRQLDEAMAVTLDGISIYGPSAILCQMRAVCLLCIKGWDGKCENALREAENFGSEPCPTMLLRAAVGGLKSNPQISLQRAARAHKLAPSAYSALIISKIYVRIGESTLAERWASCAVKLEPLLADGWAVLALLALYNQDLGRAKTMLRTATQAGPVSSDIEEELKKVMDVVQAESLPDLLVKDLCYCNYIPSATQDVPYK